jgi:TonB family protein
MRRLYKIDPVSQNNDMMMRIAMTILLAGIAASPVAAANPGPRDPILIPSSERASYPPRSVQKGEEGRVGFALTVDEKGKVTSCIITATSGYSRLDEATCRIFRQARFQPALDASGTPTTGRYESTYVFDLH